MLQHPEGEWIDIHAEINYSLSIAFNATSNTSYEIRYNIEYTVGQTRFYTCTMYVRLTSNSTVLIFGCIFTAQSFGRCSLLFTPLWNSRMWTMNCSVWLCFSLATTNHKTGAWMFVTTTYIFRGTILLLKSLTHLLCWLWRGWVYPTKFWIDLKSDSQTRQHVMIHSDCGGT